MKQVSDHKHTYTATGKYQYRHKCEYSKICINEQWLGDLLEHVIVHDKEIEYNFMKDRAR